MKKELPAIIAVSTLLISLAGIRTVPIVEGNFLFYDILPTTISIDSPQNNTVCPASFSLVFTVTYDSVYHYITNTIQPYIKYTLDQRQSSKGLEFSQYFPSSEPTRIWTRTASSNISQWIINLEKLSSGMHSISISVELPTQIKDFPVSGQTSAVCSVEFYVDSVAPNIIVLSPKNLTYTTKDIQLSFVVNETALTTAYCLDNQANVMNIGNTTLIGLSDGLHNLVVYANDTVGNIGSSNTTFTIDTAPPIITNLSIENKTYNSPELPLSFNINEPYLSISYCLDNQANVTINGNSTLASLTDGQHSLVIYASDAAGNMGESDVLFFTVNTQPSPSPTQQPTSTPTHSQLPPNNTPTTIVIVALVTVAVVAGILIYLAKHKGLK